MSEEEISQVYKNVFNSPGGEIVLEDMRLRFFVEASSAIHYDPDTGIRQVNDHETTYLNEGMRSAFQHIQARLDYDLELENKNASKTGF